MPFLTLWFTVGFILLGLMLLLWGLSLKLKDASIVDIFWGTGFVILFWLATWLSPQNITNPILILGALITIWGLRLSIHIYQRNHGKPEDFRYANWRTEAGTSWWWRSFFKVFLLQGILLWIIATPIIAVHVSQPNTNVWASIIFYFGIFIWLVGFIFEAGGDYQLKKFKANPANKGKILTTGLWGLTRHPNYFGDATQWWGFYIIALSLGAGWSIFSPIIMTFLLVKISGVAMLEKTLKETKPQYAEYMRRTNSFFPWMPKK